MLRQFLSAAAAVAVTFSAVAALADEPQKVSVDQKTGAYCLIDPTLTGSRIAHSECHSVADWAKRGVTFAKAVQPVASR